MTMSKRILMVEDNPVVGRMYQLRLQLEGFEVEVATDGQAGLDSVARRVPDAVILDLILPRVDGLGVLKKLRANPEHARIPVIVFTSNYLPNILEEAREAGANACLNKAEAGPNELIAMLRKVSAQEPSPDAVAPPAADQPIPLSALEELMQSARRAVQESNAEVVELLKGDRTASRIQRLRDRVHFLASETMLLEAPGVARLTGPLEVLLGQWVQAPEQINASTLRTVAQASRVLQTAFESRAALAVKPGALLALVVDDETFAKKAAHDALLRSGFQVESFDDPWKASQRIEAGPFDVLVSDLNMPGLTGFELCERMRKIPAHRDTPFILVTALDGFENRVRSAQMGADDFIAKPFLPAELGVKALTLILQRLARSPASKFQPFARHQ